MQILINASQARKATQFANNESSSERVSALFGLPWFRRFWTVQEYVLNVDVVLLCGQLGMTLPRLLQGLQSFKRSVVNSAGSLSAPGVQAAERTADLWKKYTFEEPVPADVFDILSLVDEFPEHECSDDRDRIFALYALAINMQTTRSAGWVDRSEGPRSVNMRHNILMDVDYSLDVQETYVSFAKACVKADLGVRILKQP
jgi:hypothetical protein